MHVCISGQQKNLVYALGQEVPKLMYTFWTWKPVIRQGGLKEKTNTCKLRFVFLLLFLQTFGCIRHWRIKMQFLYLRFKHPNILRSLDELSRSNFLLGFIIPETPGMKKFHLGCLGGDRPHKQIDRESSSEVCKILGCLNRKYENCIFIRQRLLYTTNQTINTFATNMFNI